jgi:hypothetical protein
MNYPTYRPYFRTAPYFVTPTPVRSDCFLLQAYIVRRERISEDLQRKNSTSNKGAGGTEGGGKRRKKDEIKRQEKKRRHHRRRGGGGMEAGRPRPTNCPLWNTSVC